MLRAAIRRTITVSLSEAWIRSDAVAASAVFVAVALRAFAAVVASVADASALTAGF